MRIGRITTAALVVLTAAACAPAPQPSTPPTTVHTPAASEPVVVNTLPLPERFDPVDTDDPYTGRIAGLLQRGLFRYDAKGMAIPEVAESVETVDSRVYRVTLSPGWRFTDGEPVTARSFVDAWNRAADPATPRLRRDLFSPIIGFVPTSSLRGSDDGADAAASEEAAASPALPGLRVTDELEFTIALSAPHPGFEQRLGHPAFAPLPRAAFDDPEGFARQPIGNGPYRLEGPWSSDGVRLRPSADYTAIDAAQNPGIDFRTYTDPTAALGDVEAGTLDVLDVLPIESLTDYQRLFGQRAVNQPIGQVFDLAIPEAGDFAGAAGSERRAAVSMAVDREDLVSTLYGATRTPATDLTAPVVEGHSQTVCGDLCTLDVQAATEHLEAAGGLPDGMTIAYAQDTADAAAASHLCDDLIENLAISCTPKAYPTARALTDAVASGTETSPFLTTHRMDYPLLESFLVPRFALASPQNVVGYRDPVSDAALVRASVTDPTADRTGRFLTAQRLILEDLPVVPLLNVNASVVFSEAVRDVRVDVFGAPVYTQIRRP